MNGRPAPSIPKNISPVQGFLWYHRGILGGSIPVCDKGLRIYEVNSSLPERIDGGVGNEAPFIEVTCDGKRGLLVEVSSRLGIFGARTQRENGQIDQDRPPEILYPGHEFHFKDERLVWSQDLIRDMAAVKASMEPKPIDRWTAKADLLISYFNEFCMPHGQTHKAIENLLALALRDAYFCGRNPAEIVTNKSLGVFLKQAMRMVDHLDASDLPKAVKIMQIAKELMFTFERGKTDFAAGRPPPSLPEKLGPSDPPTSAKTDHPMTGDAFYKAVRTWFECRFEGRPIPDDFAAMVLSYLSRREELDAQRLEKEFERGRQSVLDHINDLASAISPHPEVSIRWSEEHSLRRWLVATNGFEGIVGDNVLDVLLAYSRMVRSDLMRHHKHLLEAENPERTGTETQGGS